MGPPAGAISVIVPVLDEAARVEPMVARLSALAGVSEVIVVDGGSRDETAARLAYAAREASGAAARAPVRTASSPPGRGVQMNAGARVAAGDVLFFVHADVAPPPDAARWIGATLLDPSVVAGAFRTWTVDDRPGARPRRAMDAAAWWLHLADLRSRWSGLPYGDQCLFVRASAFNALGGFAEIALMEDLDLSRRLRALGRVVTVPATVRVSGRRFLARPLRSLLWMNSFPALYRLGLPPRALAALYGHVR